MEKEKSEKIILYKTDSLEILQEYNGTEEACKRLEVSYKEFIEWRLKGIIPRGFQGFQVSSEAAYKAGLVVKELRNPGRMSS